jgi:purine-binding chemotaxis protein CheW
MDISKIRKKARERERKVEGQPAVPSIEAVGNEPAQKTPDATQEPSEGASYEETPVSAPLAPIEPRPQPLDEKQGVSEGPERKPSDSEHTEEGADAKILELVTFSLMQEEFAFRVSEAEEIIRYQKITKVPTLPDYVCGITSLRGKVIPVIDLKTRFSLRNTTDRTPSGAGSETQVGTDSVKKILILNGPKGPIGAIIDKVIGVARFPEKDLLEPPGHLTEEELMFIEGVVIFEKRFISVISSADALNIEII